jgi:glycoside hydrolase-like protein
MNIAGNGTPLATQPLVADASVDCTEAAPALAARGIKVLMRYYSQPDYANTVLSAAEASAIHEAGMALGIVYQYHSGDITYFTPTWAHSAATACMKRDISLTPGNREAIHHPKGTAIYFGVDGDLTGVEDPNQRQSNIQAIMDYFQIIGEDFAAKGAPFKIGVYGSGDVCERLVGGSATYGWMAGFSIGWTNTKDAYNETGAPHWHMFQNALEVSMEGVSVDTSILNPKAGGIIGAFDDAGLIGPLDDNAVRAILRFVSAPQGATLFQSQGEQPLGAVLQNRMVSILEAGPTWSKVETTFHYDNNTGATMQGYMQSALLSSIDKMAVPLNVGAGEGEA